MPMMLLVDVFYVHPDKYTGEIRTQIVTGVLAGHQHGGRVLARDEFSRHARRSWPATKGPWAGRDLEIERSLVLAPRRAQR